MPSPCHYSLHVSAPHLGSPAPLMLWLTCHHVVIPMGVLPRFPLVFLSWVSCVCSYLKTWTQLVTVPIWIIFFHNNMPLGRLTIYFLPFWTLFFQRWSGAAWPVTELRFVPLLRVQGFVPTVCFSLFTHWPIVDKFRRMCFSELLFRVGIMADIVQVVGWSEFYWGEWWGHAPTGTHTKEFLPRSYINICPSYIRAHAEVPYHPSVFCTTSLIPGICIPMFTTFPG